MIIGDLVRLNQDANFVPAVDITTFRDEEENSRLCGSFCFVRMAEKTTLGSYEWLDKIRKGLADGNANVWSLTANYGHGKTHFGVVLANYFGQPWEAPELRTIRDLVAGLPKVGPDQADSVFGWREKHAKPYLTLCLQGHQMPTLKQAVFQEVERELRRHESSGGYAPPLWQAKALDWLDDLDEPRRALAQGWADTQGIDLEDVRKSLRERDPRHEFRESMDALNRQVSGRFPVDFGVEVTLRQLLDTLFADLCGPDGAFSGIAVVFDEFHRFVEKMGRSGQTESLQDLLEAILKPERVQKGTAFFIALSTMDPNAVARQQYGNLSPSNPVAKELDRIGQDRRFILRSEMEAVMDNLLEQRPERWPEFEAQMREPMRRATEIAVATFPKRLKDDLNWSLTDVRDKVTRGTFPFHPLTTLLLCNLDFNTVVPNPRGMLEFVQDRYRRYAPQEAERDGRPNWIVPIELYEFFSGMLKPEVKARAEAAFDTLGGDTTDELDWTVASMALIAAARLPTPSREAGSYARLVADMADIELEAAQHALDELYSRGIVERDAVTGSFGFPINASRAQFRGALLAERGAVRLESLGVESLRKEIEASGSDIIKDRPVNVRWGHPEDWAFRRRVVMRHMIEGGLAGILPSWDRMPTDKGTKDWERAVEIVFLPRTPEDVQWIKDRGPLLIQEACPRVSMPPVTIVTSETPAVEVESVLLDLQAANAIEDKLGLKDQFDNGVRTLRDALKVALNKHAALKTVRIVAPSLRTTLESIKNESDNATGVAILGQAYLKGPAEFIESYHLGQPSLTSSCAKLAGALLSNTLHTLLSHEGNGPARTIAERYLQDRWGMVNPALHLKSPQDPRIQAIWTKLVEAFPAGIPKDMGPVLRELANPPYGLDTCTLALIVCGWIGSNSKGLTLTLERKRVEPESLGKSMGELLGNLLRLQVKREDVGERAERAQALIGRIEGDVFLSRAEVDEAVTSLEAYAKAPDADWGRRLEAATKKLRDGRAAAIDYAALVSATEQKSVEPKITLERIERARQTKLGIVREPDWPTPSDLSDTLAIRLLGYWNAQGDGLAQIKDVGQHSQQKGGLTSLANRARGLGLAAVAERIEVTIGLLDERRKRLESQFRQDGFVRVLKDYRPKSEQITLRELRERRAEFDAEGHELAPLSADAQARLDAKLAEIDAEAASLERIHERIEPKLAAAASKRAVEAVQRDLLVVAARLEGTRELLKIDAAQKDVANVLRAFELLEKAEDKPPEGRATLQREIEKADALAAGERMPQGLRDYAQKVAAKLRGVEGKRVAAEEREFEKAERAIEAKGASIDDLLDLRQSFRKPSEYLSDEVRNRAKAALERIAERLAERSVEHIFAIAKTLKGDRTTLLDLAEKIRRLAEEA